MNPSALEQIPEQSDRRTAAGAKSFIIALRTGRLANRLVLFANFIAHARAHGDRVVNVTFHSYAHLFEGTRTNIYCRYPAPERRSVFDVVPGAAPAIRNSRIFYRIVRIAALAQMKMGLLGSKTVVLKEPSKPNVLILDEPAVRAKMASANRVFVYGWRFRAPRALQEHAAEVRHFLRPVPSLTVAGGELVAQLRQGSDVVIGIHIRHGDYREWQNGKYFFEAQRYAQWMRELVPQFPGKKVSFLVCSDEPRSREEFAGLDVAFGTGPAVNDLFALAKCDYLIAPLGTFSQWASFYGNVPLLHARDQNQSFPREQFQVSFLEEIP